MLFTSATTALIERQEFYFMQVRDGQQERCVQNREEILSSPSDKIGYLLGSLEFSTQGRGDKSTLDLC